MKRRQEPRLQPFHQAFALHQGGKLAEAERLYVQILKTNPTQFDALHHLGILRFQQGRDAQALDLIGRAIKKNPKAADALLHYGVVLARLRRHGEALACYDQALAIQPDLAEALRSRGNALRELQRYAEALASYERALAIQPDHIEALNNRGNTLRDLNRPEEALASYDKALAIKPDYVEALYNRGFTLQGLSRLAEALASYDRALAINPALLPALNNRGNVLAEQNCFAEALASYDRALAINPDYVEALNNRGSALRRLKREDEALASYDRALAVKPAHVEALNNRGKALRPLKRHTEALACFERALEIRPDHAEALNNRGVALRDLGRLADALASCEKALAIKPDYVEALCNRGTLLRELDRLDEALASYERAIALRPDDAEALANRGLTLQLLNRLEEALASYDRAIMLQPDDAEAILNRAISRLLVGRYVEGFADYEWRWLGIGIKRPGGSFASWQGEDLAGRRLLVFSEQGLGDTIQFARYLPLLARTGCRLTFHTKPNLVRLLQPLTRGIDVITSLAGAPEFDFQCALMSLPHRLGTELASIPDAVPYLQAEDALVARWRQRIGRHGFKVGICWQGNPVVTAERGRSIPLKRFRVLGQIPDVRLISLQKAHGLEQLAELPAGMAVETLGDDFDAGPDAFVDCAAAMQSLDLVVTCDSAVAHLGGALGRPVWLALRQVPHWAWMLGRSDSPWYPSVRLFRQALRGAWEPVFDQMAEEISGLLHEAKPQLAAYGKVPPMAPMVPVSCGELIDKITILEIKSERLTSPGPLTNVRRELAALEAVLQVMGQLPLRVGELRAELRAVNARVFEIENAIREREAEQKFDDRFIELARSVYFSNDERGRLKHQINAILNSELVEEKQYASYERGSGGQAVARPLGVSGLND